MKRFLLTLTVLTLTATAVAQNPTTYFMEGSTLRSQQNPAFAPLRGYFNIPMLGGVELNTNGNLAINSLLFNVDGKLVTILDSAVSPDMALSKLNSGANTIGSRTSMNIIGFGAYTANRKNFWSFDLNARVFTDIGVPYEMFDFLKNGQSINIRDITLSASSYMEAGFNYSFPIKDKIYVGVRAKFLVGVAQSKMNFSQFNVTLGEDKWYADAIGTLDITASGVELDTKYNDKGAEIYDLNSFDFKPKSPAGYGFAVDLGVTYDPIPNLQLSAAVNDLGFISWNKNKNISGSVHNTIEFSGIDVDVNGSSKADFSLEDLEFNKEASQSHSKMLQANINFGAEYEMWHHKVGFGLLYSARIAEVKTFHNITASVNYHPIRWFGLSGSYSMISNKAHAVGFALNLCPNWINFYVATDILTSKHSKQFIPVNQNMMNVTLGLAVPIGKRGARVAEYSGQRNYNTVKSEKTLNKELPEDSSTVKIQQY